MNDSQMLCAMGRISFGSDAGMPCTQGISSESVIAVARSRPIPPQSRRAGGLREPCPMAVRANALLEIFLEPLHSLLVLDLGKGVLDGIDRAVIVEIHFRRFQRARIDVVDVMFFISPW